MDYVAYNRLVGRIRHLSALLAKLPPHDAFRQKLSAALVDKLYRLGVLPTRKSLAQTARLPASAFCRRRLPVLLVRLKMAETLRQAVALIEQGHIRVGCAPRAVPSLCCTFSLLPSFCAAPLCALCVSVVRRAAPGPRRSPIRRFW